MIRLGPKARARLDALEGRRKVERLEVVTCYFNPCGYKRIRANYDHFVSALRHPVRTIELAFDDDPFTIPGAVQIRGTRERNQLWQKERLLNLIIRQTDADAVAWIDADILFFDPGWFDRAMEALYRYPVVQLFSRIADTDAEGRMLEARPSFALVQNDPKYRGQFGRPGGAWAARREIIEHGIYDQHVIGGGDSVMVATWLGRMSAIHSQLGPTWAQRWERWSRPHTQAVQGRIGVLPGDCVHLYHGSRADRQYRERYEPLKAFCFDPETDVETDAAGLLAWTDYALTHKAPMVQHVKGYFASRREDS